jgi:uncharacterized protein (DUF433 family)
MSTAYVSGRVPARYERLVARQARAAKTSKSDLVARYVIEKSLETEFPGISFHDSLSGREAYLTGHRVAVWEVLAVREETQSVEKTVSYFRWPRVLVTRALAYAKAFPEEIRRSRDGETDGLVLFRRTVRSTDYGHQARLLTDFWADEGQAWDWLNRVVYLPKSTSAS